MLRIALVLLLILLVGCSSNNHQQEETSQATLRDSLEIPERIGQMDSLVVFDPNNPTHQIRFRHDQT